MRITVRDSSGASESFTVPLKRKAESKFMKAVHNKEGQMESFNALMDYMDQFR